MADFQVTVSGMNQAVQEQEQIREKFLEIQEEMSDLTSALSGKISAYCNIRQQMKQVITEMETENSVCGSLKNTLGSIITTYSKAEEKICQQVKKETISMDGQTNASGAASEIEKQIEEDYKNGKIDKETYESIRSGILASGIAFIQNALTTELINVGSEAINQAITKYLQQFTSLFMNRGLAGALAGGGEYLFTEAPSWAASVVRGGVKYGIPVIGTLLDYGIQRASGTSSKDAIIKASAHTVIGMGGQMAGGAIGAKVGALIGSALPGAGTVIGAGAGFVIGVAGSMAFDYVYDHWDDVVDTGKKVVDAGKKVVNNVVDTGKKVVDDVGDAVSGFFSGLGGAIFG